MLLDQMSNLKQRLFISFIASVILFFFIYFANYSLFKPFFALGTATLVSFALYELYYMAQEKGYNPLIKIGIVFSYIFIFFNFLGINFPFFSNLPLISGWLFLVSSFTYYFNRGNKPLINIALTVFGFVYLVVPLSFVLNIVYYFAATDSQDGRWWLFYLILVTKITDIGAYFVGRKWGYTKMTPFISPKKSWEGAVAGLLSSTLTSLLFVLFLKKMYAIPPISLSYLESIFIGALISLIGQFGDLAESLLKRDIGIKDSSRLPGFGGILDLVDSLIFTCPFLYFLLKFSF
mgnify:CR=1 FL=1